jgi:hypothetical protein
MESVRAIREVMAQKSLASVIEQEMGPVVAESTPIGAALRSLRSKSATGCRAKIEAILTWQSACEGSLAGWHSLRAR